MRLSAILLAATCLTVGVPVAAQTVPMSETEQARPAMPRVLPLREQARVQDEILLERLETVVPDLMRMQGVDMWILVAREYMEDPVVATMLDATSLRARRRTILVFHDPGEGKPMRRMTVSRYGLGQMFGAAWDPESQPDQWKALADIVRVRNPRKIALNASSTYALADGLTYSQHQELIEALGPELAGRVVSAEPLAVGWLETRTPREMTLYPGIVRMAHAIIAEAFSPAVIKPGVTTADDVVWWMRQKVQDAGLATWFHPSVDIQRAGEEGSLSGNEVIQPGDLLWTDFGITYLRLNTDTQHVAYVLRPGEKDAPAGLKAGLAANNAVQDALRDAFHIGDTGNEVLKRALATAKAKGLNATIYSHPLGYHGHGAGSAIGRWDNQAGDDAAGNAQIYSGTAWSIELSADVAVPEWGGQVVRFRTEEDAYLDKTGLKYLDGRQTVIALISAR